MCSAVQCTLQAILASLPAPLSVCGGQPLVTCLAHRSPHPVAAHHPLTLCRRAGRDPAGDSARHPLGGTHLVDTAVTGEAVCVRRAPDLVALRAQLEGVLAAGIESVAVVLKHAAIYPRHEQLVGVLAREMGFKQVRRRRLPPAMPALPADPAACRSAAGRCAGLSVPFHRFRPPASTPSPPTLPPPYPHRCRCRRR